MLIYLFCFTFRLIVCFISIRLAPHRWLRQAQSPMLSNELRLWQAQSPMLSNELRLWQAQSPMLGKDGGFGKLSHRCWEMNCGFGKFSHHSRKRLANSGSEACRNMEGDYVAIFWRSLSHLRRMCLSHFGG